MNTNCMLSLIIPLLALSACKRSTENLAGPAEYEQLISNPSFEQHGTPSLDGWDIETNIDSTVRFSQDVPQSGGHWSVVLTVSDRVVARLRTTVTVPNGTHRYRLSVWAKSNGDTGVVRLILNKAVRRSLTVSNTRWTLYETVDTVNTATGDTLTVELDGGVSPGYNETSFDLCQLEIMN